MQAGVTTYGKEIRGARGNYYWSVRFDAIDGFIGICQYENGDLKDRILLSPKQVDELMAFIRKCRQK